MNSTSVVKLTSLESYKSINKNLSEKKSILQFLPKCLFDISTHKNFIHNNKKLKTSYLIDVVHNLILKYYFRKENKFNLSSLILKEKYGHMYNYYIDYLVKKEILILICKHRKGKNARIYAISETVLRGEIIRFNNSDKVIIKKYKNKLNDLAFDDSKSDSQLIDQEVKLKLIDDLFSVKVQFDRSIFFLDNLKDDDIDIYNRNKYSVECINNEHIFYHFDSYGRMHTNFTILKSFIRKNCLLIDDEETFEIDIKNSQPLFLSKLIDVSSSKWVNKDELDLFKYLTINGKYYQYIMDIFDIKDKLQVKELTYKVLFGRNNPNSKADKLFSSVFPTIHNFIKLYKRENGDYRILAYDLQKAESNLIFNKIIKSIMDIYPDIKMITVHDSIVIPKRFKENVNSIFYTKLYEEFSLI